VQLSRPDKLRVTRTGGYTDVEVIFDGKTVTINNKGANAFAQAEAPGSIDQLIDLLRDKMESLHRAPISCSPTPSTS
jgi:hypothetical protein